MKLLEKIVRPARDSSDESVESAESAEPEEPTTPSKSRTTKFLQGATVFVVMFVALRWFLSRNDEPTE